MRPQRRAPNPSAGGSTAGSHHRGVPAAGLGNLETGRLVLRPFTSEDAAFILRLLNDPSFLEHIGDKGVRTLEQALAYLGDGPIRSYGLHGHGLMRVDIKHTGTTIGMCGLLRRKPDQDPDLGYAFLPEAWNQGYAAEAAAAVLESGIRNHAFPRILALVAPGNARSIRLLQKLGFTPVPSALPALGGSPELVYEWSPRTGGSVPAALS